MPASGAGGGPVVGMGQILLLAERGAERERGGPAWWCRCTRTTTSAGARPFPPPAPGDHRLLRCVLPDAVPLHAVRCPPPSPAPRPLGCPRLQPVCHRASGRGRRGGGRLCQRLPRAQPGAGVCRAHAAVHAAAVAEGASGRAGARAWAWATQACSSLAGVGGGPLIAGMDEEGGCSCCTQSTVHPAQPFAVRPGAWSTCMVQGTEANGRALPQPTGRVGRAATPSCQRPPLAAGQALKPLNRRWWSSRLLGFGR